MIAPASESRFAVELDNFSGPFDLLLGLIAKHKLDITEIALSKVTDEFIAHTRRLGTDDLEQTSEFLLVAATLLDLKAARLLPSAEVEDPEDLARLEARDLLFARLLQYRAFKQVAALIEDRMHGQERSVPRQVSLDPQFANLLPEVLITITPEQLAELARAAFEPKPVLEVSLTHLHATKVSVREQVGVLVERLRLSHTATFRSLVSDVPDTMTTVCRFLGLLELFREGMVAFEQADALGELTIRWVGSDSGAVEIEDEYDETPAADNPEDEDSHD